MTHTTATPAATVSVGMTCSKSRPCSPRRHLQTLGTFDPTPAPPSSLHRLLLLTLALLSVTLSLGCSANKTVDFQPDTLQRWDEQSEYRIDLRGDAFRVNVYTDRTTAALEPSMDSYLRRTTLAIADDYAQRQGRSIDPLQPADVILGATRNPFDGRTYWKAYADVTYTHTHF
jgi:hypothetical protein